jgi:hypothetical protein
MTKVCTAQLARQAVTRAARTRARSSARVRMHRARLGQGLACTTVTFNGSVVDLLVKSGWLRDASSCNREAVGAAIGALLADIAENS